jgi:hypothetical protein
VRDHERDGFVVRERAPVGVQLAVESFFRPQQFARRDVQLGDEFAQLLLTRRRGRVINFLEFDAALTEQARGLAAGASSRFLVDRDLVVVHLVSPARAKGEASRRALALSRPARTIVGHESTAFGLLFDF